MTQPGGCGASICVWTQIASLPVSTYRLASCQGVSNRGPSLVAVSRECTPFRHPLFSWERKGVGLYCVWRDLASAGTLLPGNRRTLVGSGNAHDMVYWSLNAGGDIPNPGNRQGLQHMASVSLKYHTIPYHTALLLHRYLYCMHPLSPHHPWPRTHSN